MVLILVELRTLKPVFYFVTHECIFGSLSQQIVNLMTEDIKDNRQCPSSAPLPTTDEEALIINL